MTTNALYESKLSGLTFLRRGKVRDIYEIDADHILLVACDRLSAYDVLLPDPIPGKGAVLTEISNFWFDRTRASFPNHLSCDLSMEDVSLSDEDRGQIAGRAVVARHLRTLPVEAIVRGYLTGSGWNDYQQSGQVCGLPVPPGLQHAEKLPETLYTPSTKEDAPGAHDQNISFDRTVELIGPDLAEQVRDASLRLYRDAADYAADRGIIIADTKFEFGVDEEGRLIVIDELLTPDSSRFWPRDQYQPGGNPPSYDKQYVRDYLTGIKWDRKPPARLCPPIS